MDEALTGFLSVYNPTVIEIKGRLPWLPLPVYSFEVWLGGSARCERRHSGDQFRCVRAGVLRHVVHCKLHGNEPEGRKLARDSARTEAELLKTTA